MHYYQYHSQSFKFGFVLFIFGKWVLESLLLEFLENSFAFESSSSWFLSYPIILLPLFSLRFIVDEETKFSFGLVCTKNWRFASFTGLRKIADLLFITFLKGFAGFYRFYRFSCSLVAYYI